MTISLQFTTPSLILAGIALLSAIYLLTVYRSFLMRIVRHKSACEKSVKSDNEVPVSIVVYCRDDAPGLRALLPQLLGQDYNSPFEVIVVNDGSSEDIKDVVNFFLLSHSNLYITFIPSQAHNLSRRKLAVTLGVKAAHHPYVILTNADAVISSSRWLAEMAQPLAEGRQLVIGHASLLPESDKGPAGCWRNFDISADAIAYLGCAIGHKPYRCTNYNVAFATDLFLKNKGFARSLNLHNGDDDIFISEIATADNTAVVISDNSRVCCNIYDPAKYYTLSKTGHAFTSRFLSRSTSRILASGPLFLLIAIAGFISAAILSWPDANFAIIGFVITATLWIVLSKAWKATLAGLGVKCPLLVTPMFMLWLPVNNLYFKISSRFNSQRNYTWV